MDCPKKISLDQVSLSKKISLAFSYKIRGQSRPFLSCFSLKMLFLLQKLSIFLWVEFPVFLARLSTDCPQKISLAFFKTVQNCPRLSKTLLSLRFSLVFFLFHFFSFFSFFFFSFFLVLHFSNYIIHSISIFSFFLIFLLFFYIFLLFFLYNFLKYFLTKLFSLNKFPWLIISLYNFLLTLTTRVRDPLAPPPF